MSFFENKTTFFPQSPDAPAAAATTMTIYTGEAKSDDVFAFGTLLFELFSGRLPMAGAPPAVAAARIRAGAMPKALAALASSSSSSR